MIAMTAYGLKAAVFRRSLLITAFMLAIFMVALFVGARYGLLLLIGLGFGLAMECLGFGFTRAWRAMITERAAGGMLAHFLAIGVAASISMPLLAENRGELVGAHAPVGIAMVAGAFVFGACMQLVSGCGSGTLVHAGSGRIVSAAALPFFAIGSFAGAYHIDWWIALGTAPTITLTGIFGETGGLIATLAGLALVAGLVIFLAAPGRRKIPRPLWIAAIVIALLAILNLIVSGQPWGVIYGLGLWTAKTVNALGADLSGSVYWSAPGNIERLQQTVLTDVTSLTNIGIIGGGFFVGIWRRGRLDRENPKPSPGGWAAVIISGLLLGYSSRLAFGCNVGAFFSGISTGSLHGWVWFAAAFAGSILGIRIKQRMNIG